MTKLAGLGTLGDDLHLFYLKLNLFLQEVTPILKKEDLYFFM